MKKLRLLRPKELGVLSTANPRLQWEPIRYPAGRHKLHYVVEIFAGRPGPARGRRTSPLKLLISKSLKRNYFDLPIREKGLKPHRSYWWQVRALKDDDQIVAMSEKRRFTLKEATEPVSEVHDEFRLPDGGLYLSAEFGDVFAPSFWSTLREKMLPAAPVVWGHPVKVQLRGEDSSGDTDPGVPPEGPGATEPLAFAWGVSAADIYLPRILMEKASLSWDLSYIAECEQVQLQVSGWDGFSEPSNGDVMHDANVFDYYWGPARANCGADELETRNGPEPYGAKISAVGIDLIAGCQNEEPLFAPSEHFPRLTRQIRAVPCDENREQVDVASYPVNVHWVRSPDIRIGAQVTEWIWGDNPRRVIDFSLLFEAPFPNVDMLGETGGMTPVGAPSTLLIYTPPVPTMMLESSCANLTLSMDGEPLERRNSILLATDHPVCDTYVIPLDPWPSGPGYNFRLTQEWRGGIDPNSLWDFLKPMVVAALVPGIDPSWSYCGGINEGEHFAYDSLYGRDAFPELPTVSPFMDCNLNEDGCLPTYLVNNFVFPEESGITRFTEFLSSTFRGTRTVTHDTSEGTAVTSDVDEPAGEQAVVVRFETDNPSDLRYVLPDYNAPLMMRETREDGEVLWRVKCLDGVAASFYSSGRSIYYGGRANVAMGRSRFEPPRLEIWLSVSIGVTENFGHVWADIYYDLRAD